MNDTASALDRLETEAGKLKCGQLVIREGERIRVVDVSPGWLVGSVLIWLKDGSVDCLDKDAPVELAPVKERAP